MSADSFLNLKTAQLRLIAAVADHGQLQMAAAELAMTQPAASRMLAEIEKAVQAPLFQRSPRGMVPTLIGRVLARRARAMLQEMRDMAREVEELREGRGGIVRVGAVTGPAIGYLVPAIRQVKAASPEVEITVEVAPSVQLLRELAAGHLDFALARLLPEFDSKEFDLQPARDEIVALLVRRDHPLSRAPRVSLPELAQYEWVMQERGAPIRQAMEDAFGEAGRPLPRNIVNSSSLLLMIALLSQTNAIAPMAEEVAALIMDEPVGAGFAVLALDRQIRVSPYFLLCTRGRVLSPVANRLRMLVQAELAGRG